MISENIKSVTQRMAKCCEKSGRRLEDVKLVCVTKMASVDEVSRALDSGINVIAENRVQDAVKKHAVIGGRAEWHLVGHLQTNKARDAVRLFSLIHSVDSARLAKEIDKEAGKAGKVQDILIQVNVSGEASKFGVEPDMVGDLLNEVAQLPNVAVRGLMTIAPEVDDPEKVRPYFRALRELRDSLSRLHLTPYTLHLSMGMTNDFEVAIEEGSNLVRIGRAIFG